MSIFANPVSHISSHDLGELLSDRSVENIRLEFKREVPDKDETLKKISSFANTFGGYVIIGAQAGSADGRISGLPGVDVEPGYKQKLVDWCFTSVAPPIQIEVSDPIPTPAASGKVCYAIYTAESDLAPHFLNGRKGVYIRTNEFSGRFEPSLATEHELRHLLERRKLVRQRRSDLLDRARNRFRTFAERRYGDFEPSKNSIGSRLDLSFIPRFPARQVCEHQRLLSLLKTKTLPWRGVGFPRITGGVISQHESAIVLRPGSHFSMLEANVWGLLYYATEIESEHERYCGIHLNHFLGHLLVFINHACFMLKETGYVGPLRIEMRLESICGVPWVYFYEGLPETGPASALDNEVSFSMTTATEALLEKPDRAAMDLLRYTFFAMDWAGVAASEEQLENFIKAGYVYNSWGSPSKLQL